MEDRPPSPLSRSATSSTVASPLRVPAPKGEGQRGWGGGLVGTGPEGSGVGGGWEKPCRMAPGRLGSPRSYLGGGVCWEDAEESWEATGVGGRGGGGLESTGR